ncbi:MAG: F0F1 ATP synthase subunit epsilon [Gammaproteobacteria bacterium GWE2_42_36]|nr:MAG: F0F1 ATP synthase subunit epsilon [Gammaproteobacteria bacterium GWE2_42_36]HCU05907.1 F0F1 ATP synthase subunit epsilon [Coxiellaceae bacterium]
MENHQTAAAFEKQLRVDIVSAERSIFSGIAKMVVVAGEEGELGILPGHSQLLTRIKPGEVRVVKAEGGEEMYYVSGGFLEVQPYLASILADTVIRGTDIDEERALEAKSHAEKVLSEKSKKDKEYAAALIELTRAIAQLKIARKLHDQAKK